MFSTLIRHLLLLAIPLTIFSCARSDDQDDSFSDWNTKDLENRRSEIDAELEKLASMSLRSGVGAVGYRSQAHDTSDHVETIHINLEKVQNIDEIMLVPCIWRDSKTGFRADGFPEEFRIIAGSDTEPQGTVVASYKKTDHVLPRVAPLVVSCGGIKASWIRLEATVLNARAWDGKYILQLFEILVFNKQENVALLKPVTTSSPYQFEGEARDKRYLVDGFVPYLMDAAEGEQSLAFVSEIGIGEQPCLVMDLGKSYTLSRMQLHATEISDVVPQATLNNFGMPIKLLVEGANESDFSDAIVLTESEIESIYDTGPIVVRNFPEKTCRFIRLTALKPYMRVREKIADSQIGFAEIEFFSNGENVALGVEVKGDFGAEAPDRLFSALTDGRNLYGNILPIRDWLNELARRHKLEVERSRVVSELNIRHARQNANLNYLMWLVALLSIGIIIAVLVGRMIRMRQVSNIRLRLAADLHDELGANIHTIGLLSDLAAETTDDPEELSTLHRRIRSETERSGIAVRHCTNMLEADGYYTDLKEDMARASRRIMAKLENDIEIKGEEYLSKLNQRTRVDLYLFFKECLVNISRHAVANKFKTCLTADRKQVLLIISDNGRGVDEEQDPIPKSLQRRADLLRATINVDCPDSGGTQIKLTLPIRRWGLWKNITS